MDAGHFIPPLELAIPGPEAWRAARAAIAGLPRTRVVTETSDYLHAECRSPLLGFVDDIELHLRVSRGIIAVRSASRLGYGDLGVNRRRVERLRSLLARQGVLRQSARGLRLYPSRPLQGDLMDGACSADCVVVRSE